MTELEVRCCCDPRRLLGYLPAPDDAKSGQVMSFKTQTDWKTCFESDWQPLDTVTFAELEISIVGLSGRERLAYKSDHTELQTLRKIVGFREATE